ncbi:(R,R)-butanediol dehydrogenase / meso-butanediol dehydrogenase / diacetyl reductase [Micromonospora viridifaciens]|uniref:(R,R)-butanediol dehydrogenase / meso-butanediol dehydrogenase / diacetyl reductase n=1 Tax=Micromonospora viridifaciens TaxID=1881 RepID=A0A1C4XKW7_MICVI|nr:zinc-binding dehydrogenase [Micromonospora viridifaciens]SCF09074.1 (R,R)-butanediol dehydrogenase / meso-butanediol dehydrogenase / diacetyl reductase [Micromonospora viridifaciens]
MSVDRYLAVAGPRELREGEVATTEPRPGHVVVDIAYTGICGTDVHGYTDGHMLPPAVFGHEWTGSLSAVGEGVEGLRVGQRVVGGVGPACGHCRQCVAGHTRNCDTVFAEANGVDADAPAYGAFATRVQVSARRVIPVPEGLSDVEAALVEPTAVTFHAVRRVAAEYGAVTVVQGAGPIGLLTAQNARNAGAGPMIISEPSPARRALATKLGFTQVVEPAELRTTLDGLTSGLGADVVYECTGVPSLLQPSAELVRRGGTLALLGYPLENSSVSYGDWQSRELTVIGSLAYNHEDFVGAMHAIAGGRIDVASLHTGTFGLSSLPDILEELDSGRSKHTKVLIDPKQA